MSEVTWILESEVFPDTHTPLRAAIKRFEHRLLDWSDDWWSRGNAVRVEDQLGWIPGSFCPVDRFNCSSWYDMSRPWLVHSNWLICPANELVADPVGISASLQSEGQLFVRPDSPLKPFSGRVVETNALTLKALDHGYYYDDETLPVVVAPVQTINDEWRFVVVNQQVIAGSAYDPATRKPKSVALESDAAIFASTVASQMEPPSAVYVLDICRCNEQFRLLELNPFGGADLYACDATAIVEHVSEIALSSKR